MVGVWSEGRLDAGSTGGWRKDLEDVVETLRDAGQAVCYRNARLIGGGGVDAGGHEEEFVQRTGVGLVPQLV